MDEIKRCTEALVEAIRNSETCHSYMEARDAINADPELRRTVNEFRKRTYEIQNSEDPDNIYEKLEKLEQDFYVVRKNELMNQYLQTELAMCRILQSINQRLVGSVDFDIEDFADTIEG
ncbi:MAG: YlbF family regulator [Candidatus Limivivens sp.]|nr:YlbF family regulator [Candidatus Limivivens sp.]